MNQEFKQCLENKKIVPFAGGKNLVGFDMYNVWFVLGIKTEVRSCLFLRAER